jgi:ribonucleotide reductase alpha subunit
VNVWNGEEFSEVEIKRTGENQSLIEVHTDDGSVLTCTPYHKFYIQTSCSDVSKVDAQDLKEGDAIIEYKYPDETSKTITISKTVNNNRVDNTFCFTEPKRHMGVFNGILTGQCSEIMEVSTPKETAVCNLASIGLPTFVDKDSQTFNYEKLREVASVITDNLNKVIDVNYYPTDKTRLSNLRHRPIGIGIQGLADVFMLLDIPFHSDEAKR